MSTNVHNPADRRTYPDRWPRYRGKQLFEVIDDRSETGEEELLSVSHITGITPRSQKNVTMFKAESTVGYKRVQVGDIAANTMWTWQGAIGVSRYAGVVSPAYNVYRQRGDYYNPRFLDLLLRDPDLVDVYHSLSTGIRKSRLRLYPDDFLSIEFPVPPRDEQNQIVSYLDWKTFQINSLTALKKQQIGDLDEIMISAIRSYLMNGFNPSCNKQNTGFASLPTIPRHWSFLQLRRAYDTILGKMLSPNKRSDNDSLEQYFAARDVHFTGVDTSNLQLMWLSEKEKRRFKVHDGDLLVVEGGAVGNSAIVHVDESDSYFIQNSIHIVRPKAGIASNGFLRYWLMYLTKVGYISSICNVATIAHYTENKLKATPIPLPPFDEQVMIVKALDALWSRISQAAATYSRSISQLKDLRSVILHEAITGMVDVRHISVPIIPASGYDLSNDETIDADSLDETED